MLSTFIGTFGVGFLLGDWLCLTGDFGCIGKLIDCDFSVTVMLLPGFRDFSADAEAAGFLPGEELRLTCFGAA